MVQTSITSKRIPGPRSSSRSLAATLALLLAASTQSGGVLASKDSQAKPASAVEARVREALLVTYIHGVTRETALQQVGFEGLPELRRLLRDPRFPRRDNAVAFLSFLGGEEETSALIEFLDSPTVPELSVPAEDRAALLAPQALGHIAARGDLAALTRLLEMTRDNANGGVLEKTAAHAKRPRAMRDDLLEMALRGLAYSGNPAAERRLLEIARAEIDPARTGRPLTAAAWQALDLFEELHRGASPVRSERASSSRATGAARDKASGGQLDTVGQVHEFRISYANHVEAPLPIDEGRVDAILRIATLTAGRADFPEDVACCTTFTRSGPGQSFGAVGDGLDVIDSAAELTAVLNDETARFKVVRLINYCGGPGVNFAGCAWTPGDGIAVARSFFLEDESGVWLHEYGHNKGLPHNLSGAQYVMYPTINSNTGVTVPECNQYHSATPGDETQTIGVCLDDDVDLVHDEIDNCPSVANNDQVDSDEDGVGDACHGGTEPVCGNAVLESGEACDGADLGGVTCQSLGFDGGDVGCTAACNVDTSACFDEPDPVCGNGLREEGETCDGADLDGATCEGLGFDGGSLACTVDCNLDQSACTLCGNGVREPEEACDGADLGGVTCESLGFDGGDVGCTAACTVDTSACFDEPDPVCGNGVREEGETCDGADLGDATCQGLGFDGGNLACTVDCNLDQSACTLCGNGVRESEEACDGADLGGVTCQSLGFDGGDVGCTAACNVDTLSCFDEPDPVCGNGVREEGETCDGADLGDATCQGLGFDGGNLVCTVDCNLDQSACTLCGNGVRESEEACDGADLGSVTCQSLGFDGGDVGCTAACTVDTSACFDEPDPVCGNGLREEGETCDGADLGDATCQGLGFDGGNLVCTVDCNFDQSACTLCGNGVRESEEACDGADLGSVTCQSLGFDGGDVGCTAACTVDTSACFDEPDPVCGNGVREEGETCDGADLGDATCQGLGFDGGNLACTVDCNLDQSACTLCGNGVRESEEACDGADLGGVTCQSLGFDGGDVGCTAACTVDTSACFDEPDPVCGNGVREEGETCDGADLGDATCQGLGFDGGNLACTVDCNLDQSACTLCGNGVRESEEACDGADLGSVTCQSLGFDGGDVGCTAACTVDTSACFDEPDPVCGNGVREEGETCDGADLGDATCQGLGFDGGNLACTVDCNLDQSACTLCGNGVRESEEACDGADLGSVTCQSLGFDGGDVGCTAACTVDTSACFDEPDPVCGNGVREEGETCDGADLGGVTCQSLGFDGGDVGCTAGCDVDASGCLNETDTVCGNGLQEEGEACDGADLGDATCENRGFTSGELVCTAECTIDESDCQCADADGDGVTLCEGDCNDSDATVYPGAPETCRDGVDQDCDGSDRVRGCNTRRDAKRNRRSERCRNGIDDDGDGLVDCNDPECAGRRYPWCPDSGTGSKSRNRK